MVFFLIFSSFVFLSLLVSETAAFFVSNNRFVQKCDSFSSTNLQHRPVLNSNFASFALYSTSPDEETSDSKRDESMNKSQKKRRRDENKDGIFFVDNSCIDCDVCRWIAPSTFARVNGQSAVIKQPHVSSNEDSINSNNKHNEQKKDVIMDLELRGALKAMVSCPVGSIRTTKPVIEVRKVLKEAFPAPISLASISPSSSTTSSAPLIKSYGKEDIIPLMDKDEKKKITLNNIFHLGYHSFGTFGGTPYLIVNKYDTVKKKLVPFTYEDAQALDSYDHGTSSDRYRYLNFMVCPPRYSKALAEKIKSSFGGIDYLFFHHGDDIGFSNQWQQENAFPGARRLIHKNEIRYFELAFGSTFGPDIVENSYTMEIQLSGKGPWNLLSEEEISHRIEKLDSNDEGEKDIQRNMCEAINEQTSLLWTPGHTCDSICLFYTPPTTTDEEPPINTLFSGDHIYFRNDDRLHGSIEYNHYSLSAQARSIRRLMEEDFHCILPNHGRWGMVKPLDSKLIVSKQSKDRTEEESNEENTKLPYHKALLEMAAKELEKYDKLIVSEIK